MNQIFVQQLVSQRIDDMHRAGDRARLARQAQITQSSRERVRAVTADTNPAPSGSRPGASVRTFTRVRAGVRSWFDHGRLSPVENYVIR